LADVLFLDGVEAGPGAGVLFVFDSGDLDQLATRLDDGGNEAGGLSRGLTCAAARRLGSPDRCLAPIVCPAPLDT